MKFVFEAELPHQVAAIDAVVDLFAGQEERQSLFTIAPRQIAGELEYNEKLLGYANRSDLLEEAVLANRAAICVAQFMGAPNNNVKVKEFQGTDNYQRSDLIEKGGNYGWSIVEGRQPVKPGLSFGDTGTGMTMAKP